MATVNAVVYDQFKREDGTFHVQIKVFHKDVRRFIETNQYVTARQLDENLKIKDKHILKSLKETLSDYRKTIDDLGPKLDFFTCESESLLDQEGQGSRLYRLLLAAHQLFKESGTRRDSR